MQFWGYDGSLSRPDQARAQHKCCTKERDDQDLAAGSAEAKLWMQQLIDKDERPEAPNASRCNKSSATLDASDSGEGTSECSLILIDLMV